MGNLLFVFGILAVALAVFGQSADARNFLFDWPTRRSSPFQRWTLPNSGQGTSFRSSHGALSFVRRTARSFISFDAALWIDEPLDNRPRSRPSPVLFPPGRTISLA
jgi:hypothetical protein